MYVFVEASSSKAFALILRCPFFKTTGTVRNARTPVCADSAIVVVCDLSGLNDHQTPQGVSGLVDFSWNQH